MSKNKKYYIYIYNNFTYIFLSKDDNSGKSQAYILHGWLVTSPSPTTYNQVVKFEA